MLRVTLLSLIFFVVSNNAWSGNVEVLETEFVRSGNSWTINVTLRHEDTGWDHYADAWRVVSPSGVVFGTRVLYHPHENEQPFTRSLPAVEIPASERIVFIEAHDNVHGWSPNRLRVDIEKQSGEGYRVTR